MGPTIASNLLQLAYRIVRPRRLDLVPSRLVDIDGNVIAEFVAGLEAHCAIHSPAVLRFATYGKFHGRLLPFDPANFKMTQTRKLRSRTVCQGAVHAFLSTSRWKWHARGTFNKRAVSTACAVLPVPQRPRRFCGASRLMANFLDLSIGRICRTGLRGTTALSNVTNGFLPDVLIAHILRSGIPTVIIGRSLRLAWSTVATDVLVMSAYHGPRPCLR